jgi:peptide/nickel transport system substrate-binding protein
LRGGKTMKRKVIWLLVSCLMLFSLILTSCGGEDGEKTLTEKEKSPQYGDTFTYRATRDPSTFDNYRNIGDVLKLYFETLCTPDFAVDREVWDFTVMFVPLEYTRGMLAESWETSADMKTYTFNIRKGVHFQDKEPVNGREMTAYDVEYSWHRLLGIGSGFTEGSPYQNLSNYAMLESITATDKYTVVFKAKEPSLDQLRMIVDDHSAGSIVAREAVEKWGDLDNWEHTIGTGPFMLTEYKEASSITAVKNPDYWGYDEFFPKNRLPYIDTLKMLIIPDESTALAALRTGKIDMVENLSWEIAGNLAKTNPELKQTTRPAPSVDITIMVDKEPFTDIRVRKALQMAVDLETIAETYYGGVVDGTPSGVISPALKGYYTPFDEWPQEVKDDYVYNPERAKKLLAEAGFPDGFKTSIVVSSGDDLDIYQILQAYFADIGVDMEIEVMEPTVKNEYTRASKHVLTSGGGTSPYPPINSLNHFYSGHSRCYSLGHVSDPVYDELYNNAKKALDEKEFMRYIKEANDYAIKNHWHVNVLPTVSYCVYQPWLNGFNGEATKPFGALVARFWIDQELKESMGY